MDIGWTQNVVILEADLNAEERRWYLCAVRRWGWSKGELQRKIEYQAHLGVHFDGTNDEYRTECESNENERFSEENPSEAGLFHRIGRHQQRRKPQPWLLFFLAEVIRTRTWYRQYRLHQQTGPPVCQQR